MNPCFMVLTASPDVTCYWLLVAGCGSLALMYGEGGPGKAATSFLRDVLYYLMHYVILSICYSNNSNMMTQI